MNRILFKNGITHNRNETNYNKKSLNFNYNYRNITDDELQNCKKYIKSLFPVKKERYYIMNLLANLLNGKLTSEYPLYVLLGNGGNGITIFKNNLKSIFNNYYVMKQCRRINNNKFYEILSGYRYCKLKDILIYEWRTTDIEPFAEEINYMTTNKRLINQINIYESNRELPDIPNIKIKKKNIKFKNNFHYGDNYEYRIDYTDDPIILFQTIMYHNNKTIFKTSLKGRCIITIKKLNIQHNLSPMLF